MRRRTADVEGYTDSMSYSADIVNKTLSASVHVYENSQNKKASKDAAVCCRITCQKYEYYTEYFTQKVKYLFTYLHKV